MKNTSHLPYILLDSGNCRKLEQAGAYRIVRPALNAFWKPTLPESEWSRIDAEFKRDSGGGGTWTWKTGVSRKTGPFPGGESTSISNRRSSGTSDFSRNRQPTGTGSVRA